MALRVNGHLIDDAAIREERRSLRRVLAERMPDEDPAVLEQRAREWARENLIERVLLTHAALQDPAPIPIVEVERALRGLQSEIRNRPDCMAGLNAEELQREVELRLRLERLMTAVTSRVARPSRKAIIDYYRKHRAEFQGPEAVHAAHVVKNVDERTSEQCARGAIEQIQCLLREGASFERLADEFSDCPGGGGDLGYFARGEMVEDFENVAFCLAPGGISEIFRTPFGFHIVKVSARRPAGALPLEAVSAEIEQRLFARKKEKALGQYLDSLRAKARIEEVAER